MTAGPGAPLPEGILVHEDSALVLDDGSLLLRGHDEVELTELLVVVDPAADRTEVLRPSTFGPLGGTVVLRRPGGGFLLVADPGTVVVHDLDALRAGDLDGTRRCVEGAENIGRTEYTARLGARAARAAGAAPLVVLQHEAMWLETHGLVTLQVDEHSGCVRWGTPFVLAPQPGGDPDRPGPPVVCATLTTATGRWAFLEGSRRASTHRYGADYAAVVRLGEDGRVVSRALDARWRGLPGKHGLRGGFTSDGRFAVLAPVFASRGWRGRPRVLDLATRTLLAPVLARGQRDVTLLDHDDDGWWLLVGGHVVHRELPLADEPVSAVDGA